MQKVARIDILPRGRRHIKQLSLLGLGKTN